MYTYFPKTLILLSLCLLAGCSRAGSDKTADIAVIDVINNIGKYQDVSVSEMVSEFEYIPLETNENCLIGGVLNMFVTPSHIFIHGFEGEGGGMLLPGRSHLYAFGRDGRFISEIGRVGQGPGEYQNISGLFIDDKNQLMYIETFSTLLEYSYDGVFRRSITKPLSLNESPVNEVMFVRDNLFIGHYPNHRGNELYTFLLFDESGRVIKTFDNHVKFNRTGNGVSIEGRAMLPFRLSESVYVKEIANDTLFRLNEQDELIPRFVFDLGKYTCSQDKREITIGPQMDQRDYLMISSSGTPMIGTPNYIFFDIIGFAAANIPLPKEYKEGANYYVLFGIYDIVNKQTRLLDTRRSSQMFGLINDLDGGFSFWPMCYTSDNELASVLQAYEMKETLTEKYFSNRTIKNPQSHQNLKELLKNLDEYDNPVVVIGKLKK